MEVCLERGTIILRGTLPRTTPNICGLVSVLPVIYPLTSWLVSFTTISPCCPSRFRVVSHRMLFWCCTAWPRIAFVTWPFTLWAAAAQLPRRYRWLLWQETWCIGISSGGQQLQCASTNGSVLKHMHQCRKLAQGPNLPNCRPPV